METVAERPCAPRRSDRDLPVLPSSNVGQVDSLASLRSQEHESITTPTHVATIAHPIVAGLAISRNTFTAPGLSHRSEASSPGPPSEATSTTDGIVTGYPTTLAVRDGPFLRPAPRRPKTSGPTSGPRTPGPCDSRLPPLSLSPPSSRPSSPSAPDPCGWHDVARGIPRDRLTRYHTDTDTDTDTDFDSSRGIHQRDIPALRVALLFRLEDIGGPTGFADAFEAFLPHLWRAICDRKAASPSPVFAFGSRERCAVPRADPDWGGAYCCCVALFAVPSIAGKLSSGSDTAWDWVEAGVVDSSRRVSLAEDARADGSRNRDAPSSSTMGPIAEDTPRRSRFAAHGVTSNASKVTHFGSCVVIDMRGVYLSGMRIRGRPSPSCVPSDGGLYPFHVAGLAGFTREEAGKGSPRRLASSIMRVIPDGPGRSEPTGYISPSSSSSFPSSSPGESAAPGGSPPCFARNPSPESSPARVRCDGPDRLTSRTDGRFSKAVSLVRPHVDGRPMHLDSETTTGTSRAKGVEPGPWVAVALEPGFPRKRIRTTLSQTALMADVEDGRREDGGEKARDCPERRQANVSGREGEAPASGCHEGEVPCRWRCESVGPEMGSRRRGGDTARSVDGDVDGCDHKDMEATSEEDIAAMVLGSKFGKATISPSRNDAERPAKRRRRV